MFSPAWSLWQRLTYPGENAFTLAAPEGTRLGLGSVSCAPSGGRHGSSLMEPAQRQSSYLMSSS